MDEHDAADVDAVWDRACDVLMSDARMMEPTRGIRAGDRMLADAIHLDGCFQRSGAQLMPDMDDRERDAGVAALRWFGLDQAADIIDDYVRQARRGRRTGRAETRATRAYNRLDVDDRLVEAVRWRLDDSPEAFAPIDLPGRSVIDQRRAAGRSDQASGLSFSAMPLMQ